MNIMVPCQTRASAKLYIWPIVCSYYFSDILVLILNWFSWILAKLLSHKWTMHPMHIELKSWYQYRGLWELPKLNNHNEDGHWESAEGKIWWCSEGYTSSFWWLKYWDYSRGLKSHSLKLSIFDALWLFCGWLLAYAGCEWPFGHTETGNQELWGKCASYPCGRWWLLCQLHWAWLHWKWH